MKKVKIAFDVDETLITINSRGETVPNYITITTLQLMHGMFQNAEIIVWSGSGVEYATRWTQRLSIDNLVRVIAKGSEEVDISIDDQKVKLGTVNLQLK